MLLKRSAVTRTMADDNKITGRRYQDSACTSLSTAARSAVAPAGGWVVFVNCMRTIATAVDRDPASHRYSSYLAGPSRPNSFVIQTADTALMK